VIFLMRIAERPRPREEGWIGLPYFHPGEGIGVEWERAENYDWLDARAVRRKSDGIIRLTFISYLRVGRSRDGVRIDSWDAEPMLPSKEWERYGIEDPRIVRMGAGLFVITYVAVSRHGVSTALATSDDHFRSLQRHGIIFPTENKDVVLFPEKIDGQYAAIHRPHGACTFTSPEMWIAFSPDLLNWGRHAPLLHGDALWESGRVGAGPPPLRLPDGWLAIYHGSEKAREPQKVGRYTAGALLLDAEDPQRVLRRTQEPLLEPQDEFEQQGFVPQVVFPTGLIRRGDRLLVYYGAADTHTALVEWELDDVLAAMD
jgi:predicted GH43/DUF377 family glycosyl hydrolase